MKTINHALREKINLHIRNKNDISDLINGYDIKGFDFTGAIIERIDVSDQDISNCNFTRATIGTKQGTVNFNRVTAKNCSFIRTVCPGSVWARRGNFQGSNFKGAFVPYIDYKFADFRGCNFCDCVFTIGTAKSYGALFSDDFFKDLAEFWGIKIEIISMEEKESWKKRRL